MAKAEVKSAIGGSNAPSPSRVRVLLARLCADPWRKGFSIVLAILLWYFLDSRLTKEATVVCELHVVDAEKNVVTDPASPDRAVLDFRLSTRKFSSRGFRAIPGDATKTEVVLHFRGPDHVIDDIQPSKEKFYIRADKARLGDTFFEFDQTMIQGDRTLVQALVKMEPSRIALDVESNDELPFNLAPDKVVVRCPPETNGDTPYHSRLMLEKAIFNPPSVTLFGTQSDLYQLPDKEIFELDLRERPNDFTGQEIKGKLKLLAFKDQDGHPISVQCSTVPDITIPLQPRYDLFGLSVPVSLDLKSTEYTIDDFEPVPDHKVNLWVNSNQPLAQELRNLDPADQSRWIADNLRVFVHLPKDKQPERAIEPKLLFLEHTGLVRGKDYRVEMLTISLKFKDKAKNKDH